MIAQNPQIYFIETGNTMITDYPYEYKKFEFPKQKNLFNEFTEGDKTIKISNII